MTGKLPKISENILCLGQLYFLQIPYFLQNYHFHKTLRSTYLSTWYRQSGYDDCLQGVRVEEVTISIVRKSENNQWYLLLISNHWYLLLIFLISDICCWYFYSLIFVADSLSVQKASTRVCSDYFCPYLSTFEPYRWRENDASCLNSIRDSAFWLKLSEFGLPRSGYFLIVLTFHPVLKKIYEFKLFIHAFSVHNLLFIHSSFNLLLITLS